MQVQQIGPWAATGPTQVDVRVYELRRLVTVQMQEMLFDEFISCHHEDMLGDDGSCVGTIGDLVQMAVTTLDSLMNAEMFGCIRRLGEDLWTVTATDIIEAFVDQFEAGVFGVLMPFSWGMAWTRSRTSTGLAKEPYSLSDRPGQRIGGTLRAAHIEEGRWLSAALTNPIGIRNPIDVNARFVGEDGALKWFSAVAERMLERVDTQHAAFAFRRSEHSPLTPLAELNTLLQLIVPGVYLRYDNSFMWWVIDEATFPGINRPPLLAV